MKATDKDAFFMRHALKLAEKARGMTSPNPMVGAVIVKNSNIIAEDYHKRPGELHAEALAIQKAGKGVTGSTLYVTLEPCCHTDKRTPPCTKAIINSGIRRVVIGAVDPNPKVSGRGINELKNNGIDVVKGVLEDKAVRMNETYTKYITTGIPFVTLKVAMTLDGKIATPDGQSKWITGEASRRIVHKMRSESDAILTAIGTVKADNPELTARVQGSKGASVRGQKSPMRVVIDPKLEIPLESRILNIPPQTFIVTRNINLEVQKEKVNTLINRGIRILESESDRVDLKRLMKQLGGMELASVMIEGGASLNSYALQDGVVDKIVIFVAPKIMGGRLSIPAVGGNAFCKLDDAFMIHRMSVRKIGQDLMIEGYLSS